MAKQPASRKRTTSSKTSKALRRHTKKKGTQKPRGVDPKQVALAQARQEAYVAAVRLYEQALEALQRRQLDKAADGFQRLIDEHPDERELHERSHRYLQVCERVSRPAPVPETLEERMYAATLALNAGSQEEAMRHLQAAVKQDPNSDHVQYMLAVARADSGDAQTAATHLLRSIELNPDNRFLARHEPSFELLREDEAIQQALKTPPSASSSRGTES